MNCHEHCTPDTCACAGTPEELAEYYERARRAKYQKLVERLREELIDGPEREYEVRGKPFGEDGLGIWMEFGGESGVN